jgi:hypothetical protein
MPAIKELIWGFVLFGAGCIAGAILVALAHILKAILGG